MTYLVDSDRVAEYLKGRSEGISLLNALAPQGLAISLISYGELYEGIYYGRDPRGAELGFRRFLRVVDVLPLTRAIMRRFAHLRGQLRGQGLLIPDPDLLIAATALQLNLILVTGNLRHFQRIPGLPIYQGTAR